MLNNCIITGVLNNAVVKCCVNRVTFGYISELCYCILYICIYVHNELFYILFTINYCMFILCVIMSCWILYTLHLLIFLCMMNYYVFYVNHILHFPLYMTTSVIKVNNENESLFSNYIYKIKTTCLSN